MSNVTSTSSLVDRIAARKAETSAAPTEQALTPMQRRLAAAKAAAAGVPAPATAPTIDTSSTTTNILGEEVTFDPVIDRKEGSALPAWADATKPDAYTGRPAINPPPMPESDQPINCPTDYQPPPATASTPVEVAPELASAVATKGKGRPKGSKNTAVPEGVDVAKFNRFLDLANAWLEAQGAGGQ